MRQTWNTGPIVWGSVNGTTNVAQLSTAQPNLQAGPIYWWRNLLPDETLYNACLDFCQGTLNLPALGANVASVMAIEYSPDGSQVIQSRGFAAYIDGVDIFTQS
jgi:hypothetical protein